MQLDKRDTTWSLEAETDAVVIQTFVGLSKVKSGQRYFITIQEKYTYVNQQDCGVFGVIRCTYKR